jgi:uncharacterized protein (TIGR02594 family)
MSTPWMDVAVAELGTAEVRGARSHNPRILEYLNATNGHFRSDETPWCSAFVNWVMQQCGYTGTRLANARSWLRWGIPIATPVYGCIVIFSRPPNPAHGHVAFYVEDDDPYVWVLGGNQSDSVSVAKYRKRRILGYRWPPPLGTVTSGGVSQPIEGSVITGRARRR